MKDKTSTRIPDEIPRCWDTEDMNQIVRRLAAAGWLIGTNVVTHASLTIHYSGKGKAGMGELINLIAPHAPKFFGLPPQTPKPESVDFSKMLEVVCNTAPELVARPLTQRESLAFASLVLRFALGDQARDSPWLLEFSFSCQSPDENNQRRYEEKNDKSQG